MRKLGWLTVLLALFSLAGCEKTKPAGKATQHKDDDHEHKDGGGHEHKDGEKKK